jgi:Zn-dependent M28 family amino/carboxypeptidase
MEDINNAEERAPGANDNASGVSVVLEIARILCYTILRDSVQFAFFSGEEQGLWGSKKYADHIKRNNLNLHRLINLDMVGNPPSKENKVIIERDIGNRVSSNDQESQDFAQSIEQLATDLTNLKVMQGPIYDSDYMPFEAYGYVVAGIYDGGEENPSYHSKTDIPSTINFEYAVSIAKIVLATVANEARIE